MMQSPQSTPSQWPSTSTPMDDSEMPQSPQAMQLDLTEDEITDLRESVHNLLEVDSSMRSAKSPSPASTPPLTAYEILTMIDNMPCSESRNPFHASMARIESTPSGLAFIPEISLNAHLVSEVDQWNREYARERSWHACPSAFTCSGPGFRPPPDRELQDWAIDDAGFLVNLDLDDVFMAPHDNNNA